MCLGIINFRKKYTDLAMEECCRRAIECDRATYTFIKNTVSVVAEELGEKGCRKKTETKTKRGGYTMDSEATSIDHLLSRSNHLLASDHSGGDQ